jgi:hypothetical protein
LSKSLSMYNHPMLWLALTGSVIVLLFGQPLFDHYRLALDPLVFNDDARQQVAAMFRLEVATLFPNDYIVDYYLDTLPVGYRTLYTIAAMWLSVDTFSTILPYPLLLLTAVAMGICARKLGGNSVAFVTVVLVLGSAVYLDRMTGGLPRAFGFPILALAMLALVYGRILWLGGTLVAAILFYPVVAVPIGILLALILFVSPNHIVAIGSNWLLRGRLLFLLGALLMAILLAIPTLVASSKYGPIITPELTAKFPEADRGGRFAALHLQHDVWRLKKEITVYFGKGLWSPDQSAIPSIRSTLQQKSGGIYFSNWQSFIETMLLLLTIAISIRKFYKHDTGGILIFYLVAAVSAYILSALAFPLLFPPQRHVAYPLPLFAAISVPLSLNYLLRYFAALLKCRSESSMPLGILLVLLCCIFAGTGSSNVGLTVRVKQSTLLQQISNLPSNVTVAGWPDGIVQNVPYVTRRKILLSQEVHQAIHSGYTLQLRRRMEAMINAYLSTSVESIIILRDEFGVSHLIVDKRHLNYRKLGYFKPFKQSIDTRLKEIKEQELFIPKLYRSASIWQNKKYALLDLSKL